MMPLEQFKAEISRISVGIRRVPQNKRMEWLCKELEKLPAEYRENALALVTIAEDVMKQDLQRWEKQMMIYSGAAFLVVLLLIAVLVSNPTPFQIFLFRVVLAVAAAAFGCAIPGFLSLEGKVQTFSLRAGGALALFAMVYLVNPPALVTQLSGNSSAPAAQSNASSNAIPK